MKVEFHIITYDSKPTDLAGELRDWSEFVDGRRYSVILKSGGEEARVWKVEDPGGFPTIVCSGVSRSPLLDKLLGRVVQALEEHSDNLMIHGPIDPSDKPYDFSEIPKVEIDGDNFGSLEEFWDEISEKLIPGVSWGRNLDAFWDILSGGFGTPNEFELIWKNSELSEERLGFEETVRQLEIRRRQCHPTAIEGTDFRLGLARAGKGFTVFDSLVDIVRESPRVKLNLK
ncbi:MAG: barstar family protein [Aridibacter famidurans]|nr:barstar family protein [Aridibacter famidurans]